MTTTEVLRHPSGITQLIVRIFRKPQIAGRQGRTLKGALTTTNRFEIDYDETKPFFMQQNWRR